MHRPAKAARVIEGNESYTRCRQQNCVRSCRIYSKSELLKAHSIRRQIIREWAAQISAIDFDGSSVNPAFGYAQNSENAWLLQIWCHRYSSRIVAAVSPRAHKRATISPNARTCGLLARACIIKSVTRLVKSRSSG